MYICYVCNISIGSIRALSCHFYICHHLGPASVYKCKQNDCFRNFNSLQSFKKHLKLKHTDASNSNSETSNSGYDQHSAKDTFELPDNNNLLVPDETDFNFVHDNRNDYVDFLKLMKEQATVFVSRMYAIESLPRNMVQLIIEEFLIFMDSGFTDLLKNLIINKLKETSCSEDSILQINSMFTKLQNPFEHVSTEYLRFKELENLNVLIRPLQYRIGQRNEVRSAKTGTSLKTVNVNIESIPLKSVLEKLFTMPGFFGNVKSYISLLETEQSCSNFMQCTLWKDKLKTFKHCDTVLPIFIYYDDYETCNPLGSHAGVHKLGAVYASFPFLPPQFRSTLDNIILISLFHSDDRKEFGNKNVFAPLINELTHLEKCGIDIDIDKEKIKIHFVLGLIIGDNLGLNSTLGFVESFSSNYFCRICLLSKEQTEHVCSDKVAPLRNSVNYSDHVNIGNPSLTGIKEACVFNDIPSFHVTQNYSVDLMHDLLEGVCHYDMIEILDHLIFTRKYFSLDTLNFKMNVFDYSSIDLRNKPPMIPEHFRKKTKLSMSAAEMLCCVKYFALAIGEYVPLDDPVWQLYINLREILDIVLARSVSSEVANLLDVLITEHNNQYINLFNKTLKPKFHILTHYPRIMKYVGPLRHIWSMRFESKHRQSKITASVTLSRRNITYSLALKHQLILSNTLLKSEFRQPELKLGHCLKNCPNVDIIPKSFAGGRIGRYYNWVLCNNILYKNGMIIIADIKNLVPLFRMIEFIVVEGSDVGFVCIQIDTISFNEHLHAYKLCVKESACREFINNNDLVDPFPCHLYKNKTDILVTMNYSV